MGILMGIIITIVLSIGLTYWVNDGNPRVFQQIIWKITHQINVIFDSIQSILPWFRNEFDITFNAWKLLIDWSWEILDVKERVS